jgi:uncharacterized membrane protein YbhN (UPF0104 family)
MQRPNRNRAAHSEHTRKREMQTRHRRVILLSLATLAIVAGVVYYLYANADKYLRLLRVSFTGVLALAALSLAFLVMNGLINTYMFRGLGAKLSHREGFLLASAATLANQLPLPGGIVTRGIYLKHKHSISYSKYLSAQLALFVCTVAIDGLVGLSLLLDWQFIEGARLSPLLISAFAAMSAFILVFWLPFGRMRMPAAIHNWTNEALEGWMIFSKNPALLLRLLGLQMGMVILLAMRYWLAFHMLSQASTAGQALLFSTASVLTQLITFAPGGLGVREAIVGALASALGFELTVSVAAVELDRLVATLTIVIVGWISAVLLGRHISEATTKPGERPA